MRKKVLIGLSGGVDSAVAALILKKQGFEPIGVTMSIWCDKIPVSKSKHTKDACLSPNEGKDIEAAQKIAERLEIPYHVFDCSKEYEEIVLENFKAEYLQGRTPNPCIRCNAFVKFGVLPKLAEKTGIEFEKFATGHYARIKETGNGAVLMRAKDLTKDQSYFLYRLKKEQLNKIIFPLGEYSKSEIRAIARENGIPVADKPDSQDFYGGNYGDLLDTPAKEGNIVDTTGKILGKHNGIWNYTIGQRKGLGVSAATPLYVLSLNKDRNEVVVGAVDETFKNGLFASDINWLNGIPAARKMRVTCKIRSNGRFIESTLNIKENGAEIDFDEAQKSVAKGQSVVFYDGEILLGGGIIEEIK